MEDKQTPSGCESCNDLGFVLCDSERGKEIQRCGTCEQYPDDAKTTAITSRLAALSAELMKATRQVLANWDQGDLTGVVRRMAAVVEEAE